MTIQQRIQRLEEAIGIQESPYSQDAVLLDLGDSLKEKFSRNNVKILVKRGSRILKLSAEKLKAREIRSYLDEFEKKRRVELKLILMGKNNFEVMKIK